MYWHSHKIPDKDDNLWWIFLMCGHFFLSYAILPPLPLSLSSSSSSSLSSLMTSSSWVINRASILHLDLGQMPYLVPDASMLVNWVSIVSGNDSHHLNQTLSSKWQPFHSSLTVLMNAFINYCTVFSVGILTTEIMIGMFALSSTRLLIWHGSLFGRDHRATCILLLCLWYCLALSSLFQKLR